MLSKGVKQHCESVREAAGKQWYPNNSVSINIAH